jgi:hypothetical protein
MEDSKRYFKIQVGSMDVNGAPILVDINKPSGKCIEDLTSAYKIKPVSGENLHYLFFEQAYWIPKDTIASSPQASIADTVNSVQIGKNSKEPLFKAIIEEGNLRISDNKKNIFITPIDESEAKSMVESIKNHKLMQMWV